MADRFVGSWLSGFCFEGKRSNLTVYKTAATSVRFTIETTKFQNQNCTGNVIATYQHATDDKLLTAIQPTQTYSTTTFNIVKEIDRFRPNGFSNTYAFKNANAFCQIQGTAAQIHAYMSAVVPNQTVTCYTRTARLGYSRLKPTVKYATPKYRFGDNQPTFADFLVQLNQQGAQGYALVTASVSVDVENSDFNVDKNLYIKNNNSTDTYTYKLVTVKSTTVAGQYLDWVKEIKAQGKLGYLYKSSFAGSGSYESIYLFVKTNQKPATYTYETRFIDQGRPISERLAVFNQLGTRDCRLVSAVNTFTHNGVENGSYYATACVNSSAHHGVYQYRFFTAPTTVPALTTLLQTQASQGYRLVNEYFPVGSSTGLLFENDSVNTSTIEYKVFDSVAIYELDSASEITNRLQDQGNLGWFLSSTTQPLGTSFSIFSNRPNERNLGSGVVFP